MAGKKKTRKSRPKKALPEKEDYTDTIILLTIIGIITVVIIASAVFGCNSAASGLANPAAVYCEQQGYIIDLRQTTEGVTGYCVFDDNTECDEWAYYRGDCIKGNCVKTSTNMSMNLTQALAIASASVCVSEGSLTSNYYCNPSTGTWWIDLNVSDPGLCNPACVVEIATRTADINWRCTGLI